MLNNDVISNAVNSQYTAFADAVKSELRNKLANNEKIKTYTSDFDRIKEMKDIFSKINSGNIPKE